MPISVKEQIQIINGVVKPSDNEVSLKEIVKILAINQATKFLSEVKDFDEAANSEAALYKASVSSMCSRIIRIDAKFLNQLIFVIASAVSAEITDLQSVVDADSDKWSEFLGLHMMASIELMAGVKASQKTAYESI